MPEEIKVGCGATRNPKPPVEEQVYEKQETKAKEDGQMIKVGKPAPLFSAPAFYDGKFVNVDLEEYKDKWVLLCFYPGDFTFV